MKVTRFLISKRRWSLMAAIFVLLLAALLLVDQRQAPVQAKSNYLTAFRNTYPAIAGSQLDSCNVCHTTIPARNAFGADYKSHGHNFAAIEQLDSDGDGFSNLAEIQALTLPGDPSSHPAQGPAATATPTPTPQPGNTPTPPPAPAPAGGEYEIIGWNDLGMHCMNESFANLAVLPPYNTMWAQVIRKGANPQVVTDNIVVEYSFQNNTTSVGKTDFWNYVQQLFGVALPPDVGLTGAGLSGQMHADADHFVIEGVPLTPYEDGKPHVSQPYQLADLVAKDATTGEVVATTTFVAPVSTEMHCDDCHADGMREGIATGNTETNILALHDKEEHTNLLAQRPVLCANCHGSNALGMAGNPSLPNLSQAIHGKHAGEGENGDDDHDGGDDDLSAQSTSDAQPTCYQCHPGPETACLRGTMAAAGMSCESCHGSLSDVAAKNRRPWIDLPRCGNCHGDNYAENPGKLFRQSTGHGGMYCEACHGSPHAILPSTEARDNIQPLRLQGSPGPIRDCRVCHGDNVPNGPGPHGLMAPSVSPTPTSSPPATPTPLPTATPSPQPGQGEAWLAPSQQSVARGNNFAVDLRSNGAPVAGYEATLYFDPTILQATSANLGDWLNGSGRSVSPLGPTIDNQNGVLKIGAFSFGNGQVPSGENWLAHAQFTAVAAGSSDLRLELKATDSNGVVQSLTLHDASVQVTALTGDLNGDCTVNISDIMLVAGHWSSRTGDPDWDPALDVVPDGVIDISDIMLVAGHWGESCSSAALQSRTGRQFLETDIQGPSAQLGRRTASLSFSPSPAQWPLDGQSHELTLTISDAEQLGGFEATLHFDPLLVEVQAVELSDWLSSTGRTFSLLGPGIDNNAGVLHFGAFSFGAADGVSGAGPLVTLRLRPRAYGKVTLGFEKLQVIDSQGNSQPATGTTGILSFVPGPKQGGILYLPTVLRG